MAILLSYSISRLGWLVLVHHRLTVASFLLSLAANHWFVRPFSLSTALILFSCLTAISYCIFFISTKTRFISAEAQCSKLGISTSY